MLNSFNTIKSIICPFCTKNNNNIIFINNNKNYNELELITCNICQKKFTFIICAFCEKNIYCKIKRDYINYNEDKFKQTYNGLDGFNIKCLYKNCQKYFLFSKCPKCKNIYKHKEFIKEGKIIRCKNNDCQYEYIQFICPIFTCRENFTITFKNFKSYLNGIISYHNSKNFLPYIEKLRNNNYPNYLIKQLTSNSTFQKLCCVFCYRPIVFYNEENKITLYLEGQKVTCPYKDCQKSFNRIICPNCFNENIFKNNFYFFGLKIKCKYCNEYFSKLICPFCRHCNLDNDVYTKYQETNLFCCKNDKCRAKCYIITCIFCMRINIFYTEKYFQGIRIKCKYSDCQKIFNQVNCPFCNNLNIFPNGEFAFGKIYQCKYQFCQKRFTLFICNKCNILTFYKLENYIEGLIIKCNQCKKHYLNFQCPFCKKMIVDHDSTFNYKYFIKCPNNECGKIFTMISCPKCSKLNYSKENQAIFGKVIHCKENNCNCFFTSIPCSNCSTFNFSMKNDGSENNNENFECGKCKTNFKFNNEEYKNNALLYKGNFTIIKDIEGDIFAHGIEHMDDNYYDKEKTFKYINEIYNNNNHDNYNNRINNNIDSNPENSISVKKNETFNLHLSQISTISNIIESFNNSNSLNSYIKYMQDKQYKNNTGECILCQGTSESVFVPCGHRCTCYSCAILYFQIYNKCPYCKKEARTIIKKVFD